MLLVDNIRKACEAKGITVKSLEESLKLGPNTVYKWDKVNPSYDKVLKVAQVLGCTVEELAGSGQ